MALGDVMIALSVFFGTGGTLWAVLLILELLFPRRVDASASLVQTAPWRSFFLGLVLAIFGVALGLGLLNGAGPLKALGLLLLGFLGVLASFGSAGIARIIAMRAQERMEGLEYGGERVSLPNMKIGAGLLIGASMLPIVGWFFFFPVLFFLSVGVGIQALRKPKPSQAPHPAERERLREGVPYETS
jgi:hypothetical protein